MIHPVHKRTSVLDMICDTRVIIAKTDVTVISYIDRSALAQQMLSVLPVRAVFVNIMADVLSSY